MHDGKAQNLDYRSTKNYDVLRKLHIIPDFNCFKPDINTTEIVVAGKMSATTMCYILLAVICLNLVIG